MVTKTLERKKNYAAKLHHLEVIPLDNRKQPRKVPLVHLYDDSGELLMACNDNGIFRHLDREWAQVVNVVYQTKYCSKVGDGRNRYDEKQFPITFDEFLARNRPEIIRVRERVSID